ncbi:hypothetical protein JCM9140_3108 [Halalkalibacter wakoensis JCM 9140]|uniref:Uncharacterized protein n=1 Tax=Halalkalibacter wakoensis JCM 9140 TaxID=1236970 RepID=W4Q5N3_9BACI|nr:hypothetical protein [Halalkalibacter wakoensis]GAE26998.1 hypothetical protein JCM9140_3108 [Halalkalibacter wakoensis JCM 9140]
MERRYECVIDHKEGRMKVCVFTPRVVSKEELRPLALKSGLDFMDRLGTPAKEKDLTLVGYVDRGDWPGLSFGNSHKF